MDTQNGRKRGRRRSLYTGPETLRRRIKADVSGPAGHLDPHRRGTDSGRCEKCAAFFVIFGSDPHRAHCYACSPASTSPPA